VSVAPFDRADVGRIAMLKDPEGAAFAVLQRG
jgi:predicted enzyme related to lactoylglutathione lyase